MFSDANLKHSVSRTVSNQRSRPNKLTRREAVEKILLSTDLVQVELWGDFVLLVAVARVYQLKLLADPTWTFRAC